MFNIGDEVRMTHIPSDSWYKGMDVGNHFNHLNLYQFEVSYAGDQEYVECYHKKDKNYYTIHRDLLRLISEDPIHEDCEYCKLKSFNQ